MTALLYPPAPTEAEAEAEAGFGDAPPPPPPAREPEPWLELVCIETPPKLPFPLALDEKPLGMVGRYCCDARERIDCDDGWLTGSSDEDDDSDGLGPEGRRPVVRPTEAEPSCPGGACRGAEMDKPALPLLLLALPASLIMPSPIR